MTKKYLITTFVISAGVALGVFLFAPVSKTLYIKNKTPYLAAADIQRVGDLTNTIIPPIKVPKNLTENFAATLTQDLISKNENPKAGDLLAGLGAGPGMSMPDPSAMAEKFITDGLKQANENILNIKPPNLKISYDNNKTAIENYLVATQTIINNNLKTKDSLFSILDEINKNKGAGLEKLYPIIAAHEAAANQLEEVPAPSNLKNLMTEEIRLLRITANVLRALTNVENDPLGTIAATQQFGIIIQNWQNLQEKMDIFLKKFNST